MHFEIFDKRTGRSKAPFRAASAKEALDAFARANGYKSHAEAVARVGEDASSLEARDATPGETVANALVAFLREHGVERVLATMADACDVAGDGHEPLVAARFFTASKNLRDAAGRLSATRMPDEIANCLEALVAPEEETGE
jgi:hypothetical protein